MSVATVTQWITAEEFALLPDGDGVRRELIHGEVYEMPQPEARHGRLAGRIGRRLGNFVESHNLGEVVDPVGFLLERRPDVIRAPDAAYLGPEHAHHAAASEFIPVAPDIAVEVNSPNDRAGEVLDKVRWWLSHGTRQVWVVDDATRTITVYFRDGTARIYGEGDTLTGGDVLPGFTMPLVELFT